MLIGSTRSFCNQQHDYEGLSLRSVVNRRNGIETKKEQERTLYKSSQRTRQVQSSSITSLHTRLTLLRAAVFCGPANARIFGRMSSGQTSIRNSITLGVDCSEDSVVSVSVDDSEDWCRLRGPCSCLKAFIRSMSGGGFVLFKTIGTFFFLLLAELLLVVLSRDFFDESRKGLV
jgi:hypothetical protein